MLLYLLDMEKKESKSDSSVYSDSDPGLFTQPPEVFSSDLGLLTQPPDVYAAGDTDSHSSCGPSPPGDSVSSTHSNQPQVQKNNNSPTSPVAASRITSKVTPERRNIVVRRQQQNTGVKRKQRCITDFF